MRGALRCEGGFEGFVALDDGEFDGDAFVEMADDFAAHVAERHRGSKRRLDVGFDRRARKREIDNAALVLAPVKETGNVGTSCSCCKPPFSCICITATVLFNSFRR